MSTGKTHGMMMSLEGPYTNHLSSLADREARGLPPYHLYMINGVPLSADEIDIFKGIYIRAVARGCDPAVALEMAQDAIQEMRDASLGCHRTLGTDSTKEP